MQLDKKSTNIRQALAMATCSLLGAATPAVSSAAEWDIDSSILFYAEDNSRVSAVEPVVSARKETGEDEFFSVKVVLDSLTGASPNGAVPTNSVQTFTRPSGNGSYQIKAGELPLDDTFKDTRAAVSASWDKPISRLVRRTLGVSVSREFDYTSLSANGQFSRDINNRNTTLTAGMSVAADLIEPHGDIPTAFASMVAAGDTQPRDASSDNKTTVDLLLGVTQVLGHNTLGQLNYSFSQSAGYHTDPFKVLSVVDGTSGETLDIIYENRPEDRTKHSLYGEIKHFLGRDLINASYRYYTDDWGLDSHTVDLRYRWNLSDKNYLQPRMRWYQQTSTDFYRHSLVSGDPLPSYASADPRLGEFSATTIGLKFGHKLGNNSEWNIRGKLYQQSAESHPSDAIGVQKDQDLFPETSAVIIQVGYSFKW